MLGRDWIWLVFGTIGLATTVREFRSRGTAGAVLLDLGSCAQRSSFLVTVVLMVAFLVTQMRMRVDVWFPLVGIVGVGTVLIAAGTRRFQIREAGLLGRTGKLIPWQRIEGHEVSPVGALSVKIREKGWTFFCDLAPERHPQVEAILASREQAGDPLVSK